MRSIAISLLIALSIILSLIIIIPSQSYAREFKLWDVEMAIDAGYYYHFLLTDGYNLNLSTEIHFPYNTGAGLEVGFLYLPDFEHDIPHNQVKLIAPRYDFQYSINGFYYIPSQFFLDGVLIISPTFIHQNIDEPDESEQFFNFALKVGGGLKFHLTQLFNLRFLGFLVLPITIPKEVSIIFRLGAGIVF